MRPGKISPSMMCADFAHLDRSVCDLEKAGIEYLHIDIMDGSFVPNFTLGPDFVKALRKMTNIPMDIHMMVNAPERHINLFPLREDDLVSVHAEATVHLQRTLRLIRDAGAKAAVALNPATPVGVLDYILEDVDMVLVMTVNPGFAGQKLVPQTLDKIRDVRDYLDKRGRSEVMIEVDGNVSFENAEKMRARGAEIFVAGTSSIFNESIPFFDAVAKLRAAIR